MNVCNIGLDAISAYRISGIPVSAVYAEVVIEGSLCIRLDLAKNLLIGVLLTGAGKRGAA